MSARPISADLYQKVIGTYEYYEHKILGRGTHSICFEGRKIGTNQKVCIKQISIKSPLIYRLIRAQIDVLRRISHPNVLKYIIHYERGAYAYIVTELCEMNMLSRINKKQKIVQKTALEWFLSALEGYQQLRNLGYIHRDIKPENILIIGNNIKLADFGYCTLLRSDSLQQAFNVGTPLYMAPESLNRNIYSQKSDIWSFGVTFYQLISGNAPFSSKLEAELKKQLKKPLKYINCHPSIMKILKNCIQYDRSKRYGLQQLILAVKLALNEINQAEKQQSRQDSINKRLQIWRNEINFIKFLQYVKFLAERCFNLDQRYKKRVSFLLQYNIRMRLNLIEPNFNVKEIGSIEQRQKAHYQKLVQQHTYLLQLPQRIQSFDRLNFFNTDRVFFKQSLQWQTQAQLKLIIKYLLDQIGKITTEYGVILKQDKIKLIDFLITTFVLNRILIQKENSCSQFANQSNLSIILNSPNRTNLRIFQKIKKKASDLGLN